MSSPTTITCPSCGGEVEVARRAARVANCPYCESTLIVNEEAIRSLGKMALLAKTPSCLAVGWRARCLGREIVVLGRIQYRYDAGLWDEWWVQFTDDESYAWISQDEGEYMLERPIADLRAPNFDEIEPGDRFRMGKHHLWIEEKGVATMVGMQGELPFKAAPETPMRYLDLTDNERKVTIEYFPADEDGSYQAFDGRYLKSQDLVALDQADEAGGGFAYPAPQLESPSRPRGPLAGESPVIESEEGIRPQAVTCPSCGGSVELVDRAGTAMVVCGFCGGALDVSVPGAAQLLYQSEKKKRPFPIPLGSKCNIKGAEWTAIGRVHYREDDFSGVWTWDELQLYNPEQGYAFLALEEGHWMFFEPLRHRVMTNPRYLSPKSRVRLQGQTFKVFERSRALITYVEGELSWVARIGDKLGYMDAIRPPQMLSAEWTEKEMEWSIGRYLTPQEVAAAFKMPREKLPSPRGVAPAQPFIRTVGESRRAWVALTAGLLLLMNAGMAFFWKQGEQVFESGSIPASAYLAEDGYLTRPIEIPEGRHICRLEAHSSSVNNSWVAVSVAFLDEQENVLLDADAEVAYYHGVQGGERWSEGSRTDSTLVILEGPQVYRLDVFGSAGVWSQTGGDRPTTRGPPLQLALYRGVLPARYFLIFGLLALLYPIWAYGRQALFEARRWPSEEDD